MNLLIRAAQVVDAASPHNGQRCDLLIENGLIRQIGSNLPVADGIQIVEADNLHVSPGWIDMRVLAQDPGFEHKEDLMSVCRAATGGGFTDIVLLPNTQPVVDAKGPLGYVQRVSTGQSVRVHAMAAVTKGAAGVDFTDMIDLHHAGAVAFSDGAHSLQNPDLLLKTLQYLQPIGGLLINQPEEATLAHYGQMHEGVQSTLLGLKGIPALAEEIMLERDLRLLAYVLEGDDQPTEGQPPMLHVSTLSSARSVDLIRQAKVQGLPVSCDVAAHQLVFTDTDLAGFDTNLKVKPPFRSATDVDALWAGLADGTIDAIVSDHCPQDAESKNLEFDLAEFGIIGLETVFAALITHNRDLPLSLLVDRLSTRPRQVLRLPVSHIAEGEPATLTLFNPTQSWTYTKPLSKSHNSPFLGKTLTGRVMGTVVQGSYTRL